MHQEHISVGLACVDLMTASRFTSDPQISVSTARNLAGVERIAGMEDAPRIWIVDLDDFLGVVPRLRELVPNAYVMGFAPHVNVELLEKGRQSCDKVLVRGAAVRSYGTIVRKVAKL
jgi:hypothetical protein